MKGNLTDFNFNNKEKENNIEKDKQDYSKKPLLVDPTFYNNVSRKMQEGFNSSFQLADETYSSSTIYRNKIRSMESDDFFNKKNTLKHESDNTMSTEEQSLNSSTSNNKFINTSNKSTTKIHNKIVSVDLFAKQKEKDEVESYKKFDHKTSPQKKKKKKEVTKKNLDNLFLDGRRNNKDEYEKTKVNLLTNSALLDFKLNIKKTS